MTPLYVYEVDQCDAWHRATPVADVRGDDGEYLFAAAHQAVALAAAAIDGFGRGWDHYTVEDARFIALPDYSSLGLDVIYAGFHEGLAVLVSPVPLPWLPVDTRRGVFRREVGQ